MSWRLIANMPSTNLRIAVTLLLAIATGARIVALGWDPPGEWLAFLAAFGGIDAAQFTAKRLTNTPPPAP